LINKEAMFQMNCPRTSCGGSSFVPILAAFFTLITIIRTTASWFFAGYPTVYNRRRTAYARVDLNCFRRAVQNASPALHAKVFIGNPGFFIGNIENTVRADFRAAFAAYAFISVIDKRCYIF